MMHVFGQPEALPETTALIEDIVRSQIIETVNSTIPVVSRSALKATISFQLALAIAICRQSKPTRITVSLC
jgi:hypothetical protein